MVEPTGKLASFAEPALDPMQPIVDAHHHLYSRPGLRYLEDEYVSDLHSGHDVRSTIFVQALAFYRPYGPDLLRPVGETEFAAGVAERSENSAGPRLCAGIVGFADLLLGDAVRPTLEAHLIAGKGRFRGIRHILAWDADARLLNPAYPTSEDMTVLAPFQRGFSLLAELGLSFDAWILYPQMPRLAALARLFPETSIVLDHCGGIVGVGVNAANEQEIFSTWREGLAELASCPNVSVKISGFGMTQAGFGFTRSETGPSSTELAHAWHPWVRTCIELFGVKRCMFASNFPPDKVSYSYGIGLNAMKRLVADLNGEERHALFYDSASRFYRLETR